MAANQWSAVGAGLSYNQAHLERGILQYRRLARKQLLELIRSLEKQIEYQAGVMLPVRYPKLGQAMRDYMPELLMATNGRRFMLRTWCGSAVVSRTKFWGHSSNNCGLDELIDSVERKGTDYDEFVELVRHNRQLRGRGGLYGMISGGLDSAIVREVIEGSQDEAILCGTIEESCKAIVKELRSIVVLQRNADTSQMARDYFMLESFEEPDESYAEILSRYDQELAGLPGVKVQSWKHLVAVQAGLASDEAENLAPIIPIRRRTLRRIFTRRQKATALP